MSANLHPTFAAILAPFAPPRTRWLVLEKAYGRTIGRREFPTKAEADATAAVWRSQSAGVVTVEPVEVET